LASTSASEAASALLGQCLAGAEPDPGLIDALAGEALSDDPWRARAGTEAVFADLVEPLADRFEGRLCDAYARIFSRLTEKGAPELSAAALVEQYEAARQVRPVARTPRQVFVLSRVTLGADVAVTSVVMDAARQRFPDAERWFVGPRKAWELFERTPDFGFVQVEYGRGALLAERLAVRHTLREALGGTGSIVLDPDSRLSQLGLLPVCPPENHYLFESRSYGEETRATLGQLARAWCRDVLGVEDAQPWLHPKLEYDFGRQSVTAVSLGVGENQAKRIADPFEVELLKLAAASASLTMVDAGAPGSDEERRVRAAMEACGAGDRIGLHEGTFASFAALIAASTRYVGYDSAGQHAAAAVGVPLVSVFAGAPCARFAERWRPETAGVATVVRADGVPPAEVLAQVRVALGLS
jgi:ADP-heptose:LPS heptosyltransferase